MNQKGFTNIVIIAIVLLIGLSIAGYFLFVKKVENIELQAQSAVEKVLATSSIVPKSSKLLSISVNGSMITLDFNKDIMNNGQAAFEDVFQRISNALHPIIQGTDKDPRYPSLDYTVLIEGVPLDTYLATADWKAYRNEKYGFEVKYPSNSVFTEFTSSERIFALGEAANYQLELAIRGPIQKQFACATIPLARRVWKLPAPTCLVGFGGDIHVLLFRDQQTYDFRCPHNEESLNFCDQIFSTFKFIK